MAQLDVERKSHNSMWWLWSLIALLIVLTIWWFIWGPGGGGVDVRTPGERAMMGIELPVDSAVPPASSVVAGSDAVSAFESFVNDSRADSMSIDHEHTATGLRDLAAVGESLAMSSAGSASVTTRADSLRAFADQLQKEPASTRHADITRRAFLVGAGMLSEARPAADSSDISAMRKAAESIVPATPLLEQRSAVQRYWDAAAVAVTNRGGRGS